MIVARRLHIHSRAGAGPLAARLGVLLGCLFGGGVGCLVGGVFLGALEDGLCGLALGLSLLKGGSRLEFLALQRQGRGLAQADRTAAEQLLVQHGERVRRVHRLSVRHKAPTLGAAGKRVADDFAVRYGADGSEERLQVRFRDVVLDIRKKQPVRHGDALLAARRAPDGAARVLLRDPEPVLLRNTMQRRHPAFPRTRRDLLRRQQAL
mmetsp:Transcript_3092/g.11191  ORF Transcript_3092/g.11191 Transcript_3092/m.11191 type:complete len:208 (-) Transcript_3092:112-735(-)